MDELLAYALCPRCYRAVPVAANEHYCPNDGTKLLSACRHCQAYIVSPHVRYCTQCGALLSEVTVNTSSARRTIMKH